LIVPGTAWLQADAGVLDEDKDRDATRVQHKRYSLSIADCSPAFLCGQDLHDVCPFMLTGFPLVSRLCVCVCVCVCVYICVRLIPTTEGLEFKIVTLCTMHSRSRRIRGSR
jgi:hypothetical protein